MKILNAEQIYRADRATIKNKLISSIDLMEHAARLCFEHIKSCIDGDKVQIHVFCGIGNNGGDGLVISRLLYESGYAVKTYIVNFSDNRSKDFKINLERLNTLNVKYIEINNKIDFPVILESDLIVDAIFGIGISRSPTGFVKELIQKINRSKAHIISIDFPSGLFADLTVKDRESVIKANRVLTFQNPKLAFFLPENNDFVGDWEVLNIGLDKTFINELETKYESVCDEKIRTIYKQRNKFSNKGTYGHSLIIGGSFGKIGAVVLASKSALKVGSGLVTAYVPKCGYAIMQSTTPEVMTEVDAENYLQYFNFKTKANVIGIGMGMGIHEKTVMGFAHFLKNNTLPLVIDADALNILALHKDLIQFIPENSVFTPHPKEFERLVGSWKNDFEKLELLMQFSKKTKCVVLLKGAYTAISFRGRIYFNTTGNPALSTGGSGDVLTGMITGLIAQKYSSLNACILGVYLHGLTADLAIKAQETQETFIASTILNNLGKSFKSILN